MFVHFVLQESMFQMSHPWHVTNSNQTSHFEKRPEYTAMFAAYWEIPHTHTCTALAGGCLPPWWTPGRIPVNMGTIRTGLIRTRELQKNTGKTIGKMSDTVQNLLGARLISVSNFIHLIYHNIHMCHALIKAWSKQEDTEVSSQGVKFAA